MIDVRAFRPHEKQPDTSMSRMNISVDLNTSKVETTRSFAHIAAQFKYP